MSTWGHSVISISNDRHRAGWSECEGSRCGQSTSISVVRISVVPMSIWFSLSAAFHTDVRVLSFCNCLNSSHHNFALTIHLLCLPSVVCSNQSMVTPLFRFCSFVCFKLMFSSITKSASNVPSITSVQSSDSISTNSSSSDLACTPFFISSVFHIPYSTSSFFVCACVLTTNASSSTSEWIVRVHPLQYSQFRHICHG